MALEPGTRFGSYEVVEPIGAGGMGEVYRATDTSLKRDVALKVLPDNCHLDPEASKRFEREARLLAALNHPNIATLHGLETAGDVQALVMELVDGESLDARIARSPRGLPAGDAIEIAEQIATALDAAHERGVVHRDLKPANIKIRPDGTVKVLDFGVAKAFATEGGAGAVGTVTQMPGAIVGTPSYMSPEQASGADVDRRTDIWAFGCVLYEMLTGQRVFDGETSSRIVARVLERDPDWSLLPGDLPPRIRTLLRQCLEKNVRRRRRDAGDVRLELELAAGEPDEERAVGTGGAALRTAWLAGATGAAMLAIAVALYLYVTEEPLTQSVWDVVTPVTREPDHVAVSPDGRYIAYVASKSPETIEQVLYVRGLETGEVVAIPNSEGSRHPCWSPDSRSIAYFAREYLHRVDINGGGAQRLAPALNGAGCSWGENGRILFTPNTVTGLFVVPASGEGTHSQVTEINLIPNPGDPTYEIFHRYPSFIPGTDQFLYSVRGGDDVQGIYLGSLGGTSTRLIASDSAGVFVEPHWLVYGQNGQLVARQLDLDRRALIGDTETLARFVNVSGAGRVFSASRDGSVVAYRDMGTPPVRLTMFDRDGHVLSDGPGRNGPDISSDDLSVAYDSNVTGNRDVYVMNLDGTGEEKIVGDATVEGFPEFSSTDRELVYERQRTDDKFFELWTVEINRSDEARLLHTEAEAEMNLIPLDVAVGDLVLFSRRDRDFLSSDLAAVSLHDDDRAPVDIAVSEYEERLGEVSPDGNFVVFDSNQPGPGRFGVYVQAFPGNELGRHQVTDNGFAPRFNKDGTEIVFFTLDGRVMAASFGYLDSELIIGSPETLFRAELGGPFFDYSYDLTSDGRFLINVTDVDESPLPITVIQNPTVFNARD